VANDDILYQIDNHLATITINRPKVLNACTGDNFDDIEQRLIEAGEDPKVGVIVLTGTGERAFCVGGDVNWEKGEDDDLAVGEDDPSKKFAEHELTLNRTILECPKPVIARVNGYAIGGGNHVAYFCDLTIAAEHSIFGQNGPRVGSPAGGHLVAHAVNVLGHKRAREMWMLCRKYSAQQALEWGLVNAVVPMEELDQEVRKWADEMLVLSPTCLRILKRSFRQQMEPLLQHTVATTVQEVAPNYFETGEQLEGATAFLEKRPSDFSKWR